MPVKTTNHPWEIDAQDFPSHGSPEEQLEFALRDPRTVGAIGRDGFAQVITRLGYGAPALPSPRRSHADVIERP